MGTAFTVALRRGPFIMRQGTIEDGDRLVDAVVDFGANVDPGGTGWDVAGWNGKNADTTRPPDVVLAPEQIRNAMRSQPVARGSKQHHRPRTYMPPGEVVELVQAARVAPGTTVLVTEDPNAASVSVGDGLWPAIDPDRAVQAVVKSTVRTERGGKVVAVDVYTTAGALRGLPPTAGLRPVA